PHRCLYAPWRGGGRFGNHAFGPFPVLARLAWCAGIGSLPCDDSVYVCPALGGISCQKMDFTCETHRKDRDITQHLRKPGAHRAADRGPCSVAANSVLWSDHSAVAMMILAT